MRQSKLTALQKNQAEVAAACGVSIKEIAKMCVVPYTSMRRYLNSAYAVQDRVQAKQRAANRRERKTHYDMVNRCCNSSHKYFPNYGGRGITVCDRWKDSYEAFIKDIGPRPSPKHSLDRIDNQGNYEPGNCRWANSQEQTSNRRNNVMVSYRGTLLTLAEASRQSGIAKATLEYRLLIWALERLFEPVQPRKLSYSN